MNSSPLSSLFQMDEQRKVWASQKPVFSSGNELRFHEDGGELVFGYFVASGEDGDKYIALYKAHAIPSISSKGNKFTANRFCPVLSGYQEACPICEEGTNAATKDRMSMWFYVTDMLHTKLPEGKMLNTTQHENRIYYHEPINDFRVWHTSAWTESPWDDIVRMAHMYQGLHNLKFQMVCSGKGMARRFKIYPMPTPDKLPDGIYERAAAECKPLPDMLKEGMGAAVQSAPATPTTNSTFNPSTPAVFTASSSPPSPPAEVPPAKPEADPRRPLQSLF